jgi:hypothetical protein
MVKYTRPSATAALHRTHSSTMSAPPPPPPAASTHLAPSITASKPKSKWHVDIVPQIEWRDQYPLHCAAQEGNIIEMRVLASGMSGGAITPLDTCDDDGWCATHYAAWYGHTTVIAYLHSIGVDMNVLVLPQRATPLHFAAGAGRLETVRTLLHSGADTSLRNEDGQNARQLCATLKPEGWEDVDRAFAAHAER